MRIPAIRALAASLGVLLACRAVEVPVGDTDVTTPGSTALTLNRLGPDSLAFAFYSGIHAATHLVVRDQADWDRLWQDIHATVEPKPPLPSVDFGAEMVVAAALGTRNSGGYNVLLTEATEDAGDVVIRVRETSPGADCATTQALTQPVDVARMVRRDGAVRFVVTRDVRTCGP